MQVEHPVAERGKLPRLLTRSSWPQDTTQALCALQERSSELSACSPIKASVSSSLILSPRTTERPSSLDQSQRTAVNVRLFPPIPSFMLVRLGLMLAAVLTRSHCLSRYFINVYIWRTARCLHVYITCAIASRSPSCSRQEEIRIPGTDERNKGEAAEVDNEIDRKPKTETRNTNIAQAAAEGPLCKCILVLEGSVK